jgi:CheY-like chemotaxis protein
MADEAAVLIIDDDETVRGAFRRVLQGAGLTVLEADDGDSGLALCGERAPGVVFVDLRMPKMDGLAVLDAMDGVRTCGSMLGARPDSPGR